MENPAAANLDSTFAALSDPTRRALLARLARGAATVGELADMFDWSLPAVSRHIRVLEQAGLVQRKVEGRVHWLALAADPMREAVQWLAAYETFWNENFEALDAVLQGEPEKGET